MCGIAFAAGQLPDEAARALAVDEMEHRGPDGAGRFDEDGVWIGHTRLSILDLTTAADQPMTSTDGRWVLSYNGEIYNYRELRGSLEQAGWPLRGTGDTEVLLGLLALEGAACLPRLRGMFAFVLWDRERRRLLAARDHLGIKPLYYASRPGRLLAASELRTIARLGGGTSVDPAAVEQFLLTGSVSAPTTIYADVRALPPGHLIEGDADGVTEQAWWEPPHPQAVELSTDELLDELDRRLDESVRLHLRADVPVASFLSGGIDSSLVTSYAAEHSSDIRTFSVGFGDASAEWDETAAAALVAERYGTTHTRAEVGVSEFQRLMPELPLAVDQPSVDGVNSYFVCAAAAPSVKVCLSGQGGDELFAGYNIFQFAARLDGALDRLPGPTPSLTSVGAQLRRLPARYQYNWYLRGLAGAASGADPRLLLDLATPLFGPAEIGVRPPSYGERNGDRDVINGLSRGLIAGYLADTLLRDMDAMSMQHSLEVRVPLVDHELTAFALSIPGRQKVSWEEPKRLLRRLARRRLPAELLDRSKQGFTFPMVEWLARPGCRSILGEILDPRRVRDAGLVDPELVTRELTRFDRGSGGGPAWLRGQRVWGLYVLHRWHEAQAALRAAT